MEDHDTVTDGIVSKKPRLASNAVYEKQFRFNSTKRKKRHSAKRWAKQTTKEKQLCTQSLQSNKVTHCAVCFKEDDMDTSELIEWI